MTPASSEVSRRQTAKRRVKREDKIGTYSTGAEITQGISDMRVPFCNGRCEVKLGRLGLQDGGIGNT